MSITRYKGQPKNITLKAPSNPLAVYGFDYPDIIEVRINLKKDLVNDLDDAYLQKSSLTNGVVIDAPNHTFTLVLNSNDYSNLNVGTFYITLNIQTQVGADFIEIKIEDRQIVITPDTNRN